MLSSDQMAKLDQTNETADGRENVDLTSQQMEIGELNIDEELDDVDLLDATIDPRDLKTRARVNEIKTELRYEETFIRAKLAYRAAMDDSNPFKLDEWEELTKKQCRMQVNLFEFDWLFDAFNPHGLIFN